VIFTHLIDLSYIFTLILTNTIYIYNLFINKEYHTSMTNPQNKNLQIALLMVDTLGIMSDITIVSLDESLNK